MFQMLVVALVLCFQLSAQVTSTRCDEGGLADNAKPSAAVAYLARERTVLSSSCVIKAIRTIREHAYKPGIPVLVRYLDFRMPPPFVSFDPLTQPPTGGLYPAADLLTRFGEAAAPALQSAIADEDLHSVSRSNAVKALFIVAKDKSQVISLAARTARLTRDADTANVLRKLTNVMESQCRSDELEKCKEALSKE